MMNCVSMCSIISERAIEESKQSYRDTVVEAGI